jgi:hypothetical protein
MGLAMALQSSARSPNFDDTEPRGTDSGSKATQGRRQQAALRKFTQSRLA